MNRLALSNIELYFSNLCDAKLDSVLVENEEANHIVNVMRHRVGDKIYLTNGFGEIFFCQIVKFQNNKVSAAVLEKYSFTKKFPNITLCIPILRNLERFEFALEKSVELGINQFILFRSKYSVSKNFNRKRIERIVISAMKQSLQCWFPIIKYADTVFEISKLNEEKIIFDQSGEEYFSREQIKNDLNYLFIFGPEGGLSKDEINLLNSKLIYKLSDNRLRTETAVIKAVSQL